MYQVVRVVYVLSERLLRDLICFLLVKTYCEPARCVSIRNPQTFDKFNFIIEALALA
jgi:hypothetical protein